MRAVTHVPFGVLVGGLALSTGAVFFPEMGDPTATDLVVAAVGSLLPDIDHPRSLIGRLLAPLSRRIELRWGHRTITHSWVFLVGAFVFLLPLFLLLGPRAYLAGWFGILSHVALDMTNVTGVPFFWPHRTHYVTPPVSEMRIRTGSGAEYVLAAILFGLAAIFTPLSQEGLRSSFYRLLTRDIYGASREVRRWFPEWELTAQIRGTWRDTLLPTDYEERLRVVAVAGDDLYLGRGDAVFSTGGQFPAFTIDRILVERTRPTKRTARRIVLEHQLLDEVGELGDNSVLSGTLLIEPLTEDQRLFPRTASEEFDTIRFIPRGRENEEVFITYCPGARFRLLFDRGIFVLSGSLTVSS